MKCDKPACYEEAVLRVGVENCCRKHYRFWQMRHSAKRYGKRVPSVDELESYLKNTDGLKCPQCSKQMLWIARDDGGRRANVVSLQHYHDGTLGFLCLSCNVRHAFMPEDTFKALPDGYKFCGQCRTIKPLSDFYNRNGDVKVKIKKASCCKSCNYHRHRIWKLKTA